MKVVDYSFSVVLFTLYTNKVKCFEVAGVNLIIFYFKMLDSRHNATFFLLLTGSPGKGCDT